MITLYGHPFSRAHRVMWMLKESDLPFTHVPTDFMNGATHEASFLELNPNGRVPVLVDDDVVLFESLAINLYLSRRYPSSLTARNVQEEGQTMQWSFWCITEIEKPLIVAACNRFIFPEADRDEEECQQLLERLRRPFRVLDAHLTNRAHLVGNRFTVADLNVAAVMTLLPLAGVQIDEFPHMQAWLGACLERPSAADWKPIRFTVRRPPAERMLVSFL